MKSVLNMLSVIGIIASMMGMAACQNGQDTHETKLAAVSTAPAGSQADCQTQDIVTVCADLDQDGAQQIFVTLGEGSGIVTADDSLYLGISVNGVPKNLEMEREGGTRGLNPWGRIAILSQPGLDVSGYVAPVAASDLFANARPGQPAEIDVYFRSGSQYYSNYGENFHFNF